MGSDTYRKSTLEVTWRRRCLILVAIVLAIGSSGIVMRTGKSDATFDAFTNNEEDALVVVKGNPEKSIALVTSASARHVGEYGELKASFVHAISMDNKVKYCKARGWSFIVGGETSETKGRSARWNKIAWLRRLLPRYQWLVWMDLDTLFTSAEQDILDVLMQNAIANNVGKTKRSFFFKGEQADIHFTLDGAYTQGFETRNKVNTGIMALRRSTWTHWFLDQVWEHNDNGEGQSDQNSINHIYHTLLEARQADSIHVHPKWRLNAFPDVRHYVPTDGYERAPPGDERIPETLVIHFAGQYAGARGIDGNTPPIMLLQFLDLLLQRHATYLSSLAATEEDTSAAVSAARTTLQPCLEKVHRFYTKEIQDSESGILYFGPTHEDEACDPTSTLRNLRPRLAQLLPSAVQPLTCSRPDPPILLRDETTQVHNIASLIDQKVGAKSMLRLKASFGIPLQWSSSKRKFTASFGVALIQLDCAWLVSSTSVFARSAQGDLLDLGTGTSTDEVRPHRGVLKDEHTLARRRDLLIASSPPEQLGTVVVIGPLPSRHQLYTNDEFPRKDAKSSKDNEVIAASYFWRFLGPLALTCLKNAPESARLVILASTEDEFAPFAASDDDWRSIGITRKPEFLFAPHTTRLTNIAYADELLACQFYEQRPRGASTLWVQNRRDLLKIATASLGRLGQALQRHHDFAFVNLEDNNTPTVAIVCGAPGGFRDCDATLAAVKKAATFKPVHIIAAHRIHGQSDEPPWHALLKRRFIPPSVDIVIFPRVAERFDFAPLLAAPCVHRGTVFIQIANSASTPGYSFTQSAADALGVRLVVLPLNEKHRRGPGLLPSDLSSLLSAPLSTLLDTASQRKAHTTPFARSEQQDDDDVNNVAGSIASSSTRRRLGVF